MKIGHRRPRDEPVWSLTEDLAQTLSQGLIVYSQCGTGVVSDQTISLDQDVACVLEGGYIRLSPFLLPDSSCLCQWHGTF